MATAEPPGFDGDPDHPILDSPWNWELREFTYYRDPVDWRESFIDLVFERDGTIRRLRFMAPQNLEMSAGLPNTSGMCIVDVSDRHLENLRVRVVSFEMGYCVPSFWAANVVEIFG